MASPQIDSSSGLTSHDRPESTGGLCVFAHSAGTASSTRDLVLCLRQRGDRLCNSPSALGDARQVDARCNLCTRRYGEQRARRTSIVIRGKATGRAPLFDSNGPSTSAEPSVNLSSFSVGERLRILASVNVSVGSDAVKDCGLMIDGTSVAQGNCGGLSAPLALYDTVYSLSVYADVSGVGRVASPSQNFSTPLKALVADATINWGPNGWDNQPYAGPNSRAWSTPNFGVGSSIPVDHVPLVFASCATNGGIVNNDGYGGAESSTIWVDIPAYGSTPWMSTLYFNTRGAAAANNLPAC